MSTIKISAKSIDEINFIYKKIKKEFYPLDSIKLNQVTMDYELNLKRNELDGSLKSICDKVIDSDDLMDGDSVFKEFNWTVLNELLEEAQPKTQMRPLKAIWSDLSAEKRRACFNYLCEEMGIDHDVPDSITIA
ncbi:MAG: hypothetical protein RIC35_14620 [Marinoscillum sp.]